MGTQIYFKIAGQVDLDVLIIFITCQIFDIINVFELLPKTCGPTFPSHQAVAVSCFALCSPF
jgi:hypothetical protein